MDYFSEFFKTIPRQGPGEDESTLQALSFMKNLPAKPKILDIGCGSGAQTIALAKAIDCEITALDIQPEILEVLRQNIKAEKLEEKITPVEGNMLDMPFQEESFDIIWSEGTIYNMGFEAGVSEFKRFLKPGGYLAVSELVWTRNDIPSEIYGFWKTAYPGMDFIGEKINILERKNYLPKGFFLLSENAWMENYYLPIQEHKQTFLKDFSKNPEAKEVIRAIDGEFATYRKFKAYYNYAFFIAQRQYKVD